MGVPDQDQRTVEPSARRVADFRKRGEIALSKDATGVLTIGGGILAGAMFARGSAARVLAVAHDLWAHPDASAVAAGHTAAVALIGAAAPVAIGAFLGFLIAAALQLGWPPTLKGFGFDLTRIFSPAAVGNLLSPKALAGRALGSLAKTAVVAGACTLALIAEWHQFAATSGLEPSALAGRIGSAFGHLLGYALVALAALGGFDYFRKRRDLKAKMRMTPQEAKREHREQEGDPHVKRRRRQRMRELAKRRLGSAVRSADVVVVNPTHVAVALRYQAGKDRAPKVVAKGRGEAAERIRDMARAAGVPIVEQPPLARLLCKTVAEGREIPSAVYHAVAEVLAYVYRLRRRAR